jgi:oligoribonuclease NrnB/cAMP/cGMP phosphodiesterase (DHH superfamily)
MYFNPDKEVPDLLQMIEIRDLWTWDKLNKYPAAHVRKVLAAFDSYERSFQVLDFQMGFGKMGIPNPHEFIGDLAREGESIERFRQKMVHGHVRRAVRRELAGHQVMMVNCTSKELASDVGNKLCSEFGIIAAVWWYDQHDHMASVSLRSNDDINVDVSELAAKHGGGGHRNAAGFTTKLMSLLYPI